MSQQSIELSILQPLGIDRPHYPVTMGVPFPEGMLRSEEDLRVEADGIVVPLQTRTMLTSPDGSAKWLLLAFSLESLMVVWLPAEVIAANLGGEAGLAIPLAVVLGVPAYLNGFAAVPLIGELMSMGMAPGAALAFLVAGGVTSLPAAMAVFALVRAPLKSPW